MITLYDILELSPSATPEEIRRAFRRLSKQYHPDVNDGAAWAELQFKEINHAYQILSDPALRREYDQSIRPDKEIKSASDRPRRRSRYAKNSRKASDMPSTRRQRSPYGGFFVLLGITAVLILGRIWHQEQSHYRLPVIPAQRSAYQEADPAQIRERLELLYLYQEFPRLFRSEDARELFKAPLPYDFAADLKCFLMEGDTAGFNRMIRKVVVENQKPETGNPK